MKIFKNESVILICAALIIVLFMYTATNKLISPKFFSHAMRSQPFNRGVQNFLIHFLPGIEIGTALLIVANKTRFIGLSLSLLLLLVFTGYIILIKSNFYGKIPCTCGGVIEYMSWTEHLWFNLFFIVINLIAVYASIYQWLMKHER